MIYKRKKEKSMNTIKKHIIISGVPRTGKTQSICRKLAETGYYQHVMMDSITQSFEYIFPQLEIFDGHTWEVGMPNVSKKLIDFLAHLVHTEKYDDLEYRMLVDMYQLMPEDYVEKIKPECCKVYFVGYPNVDLEEKFKSIREHETKWDWTKNMKDEDLKERIRVYTQESKLIQAQCEKYHLPFFDFSYNREKKTGEIVKYILEDNGYKSWN